MLQQSELCASFAPESALRGVQLRGWLAIVG
jgi:hypothetical protein